MQLAAIQGGARDRHAPSTASLRIAAFDVDGTLLPGGVSAPVHRMLLVAADLGVTRFSATRLTRSRGVFTGEVPASAASPKHEVAAELAAGRPIDWAGSLAVGDALPDADLLARVGHPYAFEPSPALISRARRHGWSIAHRYSLAPLVRSRLGLGAVAAAA